MGYCHARCPSCRQIITSFPLVVLTLTVFVPVSLDPPATEFAEE